MRLQDTETILKSLDKNRSLYDPSRNTVGAIYRSAQMSNAAPVIIGDMTNELSKGLVEDINDALSAPRKTDEPFFLMVHEKKDLQMKSAILRRMLFFNYRPWPEDDTTVFWKNPKTQEVRFCWSLPHWSEMDNVLMNEDQFEPEFISQIKAWKAYDLRPFGFYYHPKEKWIPNPKWKDKRIDSKISSASPQD